VYTHKHQGRHTHDWASILLNLVHVDRKFLWKSNKTGMQNWALPANVHCVSRRVSQYNYGAACDTTKNRPRKLTEEYAKRVGLALGVLGPVRMEDSPQRSSHAARADTKIRGGSKSTNRRRTCSPGHGPAATANTAPAAGQAQPLPQEGTYISQRGQFPGGLDYGIPVACLPPGHIQPAAVRPATSVGVHGSSTMSSDTIGGGQFVAIRRKAHGRKNLLPVAAVGQRRHKSSSRDVWREPSASERYSERYSDRATRDLFKTKRSPHVTRPKSPNKAQQVLAEIMGELVHRADIPPPPPFERFSPEARQVRKTPS
jgi:hypothetical protein